jgi:hypothetical protein
MITMDKTLKLQIRPELYGIVRADPGAAQPGWVPSEGLVSITRTEAELSIVCREASIPKEASLVSRGWRALEVEGPLDLAEVGILSRLIQPLAAADISVFAVSTYDTDYLLIQDDRLDSAKTVLQRAGYIIDP